MHYTPATIRSARADAVAALGPAFARSYSLDVNEWLDRCEGDEAQLWRHGDLWAITEVRDTAAGRLLVGVALGGAYNDELIPEIERWAKSVGCVKALLTGRKGFTKRLPEYKIKTVTLEKDL